MSTIGYKLTIKSYCELHLSVQLAWYSICMFSIDCVCSFVSKMIVDNFRNNVLEDGDIKMQSRQTFHTKKPMMSARTTSSQEPSRHSYFICQGRRNGAIGGFPLEATSTRLIPN